MNEKHPHLERRFRGLDTGRVLIGRQIGFWAWKGDACVTNESDGYVVNGERFIPLSDGEEE